MQSDLTIAQLMGVMLIAAGLVLIIVTAMPA